MCAATQCDATEQNTLDYSTIEGGLQILHSVYKV